MRQQCYVVRTFHNLLPFKREKKLTQESPCIILTTYHSLHTQHLKEKLLRMNRYGPKHVELTPEY